VKTINYPRLNTDFTILYRDSTVLIYHLNGSYLPKHLTTMCNGAIMYTNVMK